MGPSKWFAGATPTVDLISRRAEMDLWYITWTLWLDIQILMKTIFEVLRKRNAYEAPIVRSRLLS